MFKNTFYLLIALFIYSSCTPQKEKVDLIIHHAKIYTVDSLFSIQEAMAIKEGRIIEINSKNGVVSPYLTQAYSAFHLNSASKGFLTS